MASSLCVPHPHLAAPSLAAAWQQKPCQPRASGAESHLWAAAGSEGRANPLRDGWQEMRGRLLGRKSPRAGAWPWALIPPRSASGPAGNAGAPGLRQRVVIRADAALVTESWEQRGREGAAVRSRGEARTGSGWRCRVRACQTPCVQPRPQEVLWVPSCAAPPPAWPTCCPGGRGCSSSHHRSHHVLCAGPSMS